MANNELERDWDKQKELAGGDLIKASIGILRCSQHAHILWRDYLASHDVSPDESHNREDVDIRFHQRCIAEYENIISVIEDLREQRDRAWAFIRDITHIDHSWDNTHHAQAIAEARESSDER